MPKHNSPRHGSMQYWPRAKSKKPTARVRSWNATSKDAVHGFIGYKVGMTHIIGIDTRKTSTTKGEEIAVPVTVLECPAMKVVGARLYREGYIGAEAAKDVLFGKFDKHLGRKLTVPKQAHDLSLLDNLHGITNVSLLVYTQPHLIGFKKKPEFMEIGLSGTVADKVKFIKDHHDKELPVTSIFKEGELVDIHAVSKGKGLHGPIRRFGVALKVHKTEKGVRRVGTLGAWSGQGHTLYRVPHPGQMGYHMRTEFNKQIFKISTKPEEVAVSGGFNHYGNPKNTYMLIKGSIAGSAKRAIILTKATRIKTIDSVPTIVEINTSSKQ